MTGSVYCNSCGNMLLLDKNETGITCNACLYNYRVNEGLNGPSSITSSKYCIKCGQKGMLVGTVQHITCDRMKKLSDMLNEINQRFHKSEQVTEKG